MKGRKNENIEIFSKKINLNNNPGLQKKMKPKKNEN